MAIRKLSTNKWQLDYAFRDENGKQHRIQRTVKCNYAQTKILLEDLKIELHEKIQNKNKPAVKPLTMLELKERYTEYLLDKGSKLDGIKHYVRYPAEYFGESTLVRNLSQPQLEEYRKWLKEQNPKRSISTINRAVQYFRAMIYAAVDYEWGGLEKSPFKKFYIGHEERKMRRVIKKEELELLIKHSNPPLRDIVYFLYYTGCRKGEVLNMKWQQVDMEQRQILLKTKDSVRKGRIISKPINNQLLILLKTREQMNRFSGHEYVFPSPKVAEQPLRDIKKTFRRACMRAGLVDITPHMLRHSYVTHLLEAGVDIETVSKLVGHSSIKITSEYYSHLSKDYLLEVSNIIGDNLPYKKIS